MERQAMNATLIYVGCGLWQYATEDGYSCRVVGPCSQEHAEKACEKTMAHHYGGAVTLVVKKRYKAAADACFIEDATIALRLGTDHFGRRGDQLRKIIEVNKNENLDHKPLAR